MRSPPKTVARAPGLTFRPAIEGSSAVAVAVASVAICDARLVSHLAHTFVASLQAAAPDFAR